MKTERRYPRTDAEHELGIAAARRRAEWELGDASWAHVIVRAYLNPAEDTAALRREMEEDE